MEDIRKKCNLIVELLKFISNKKNIEWSCSLNLQQSLLLNFVQSLITLGQKKLVWMQIFLMVKNS